MGLPKLKLPIQFQKPPLKLVICQIRFPHQFKIADRSFLAPFAEAIRKEYPRTSQESQFSIQVGPQGVAPVSPENVWRFSDRDDRWSIVLAESALTLEVKGYTTIDDLLPRFQLATDAAKKHLGIEERARLGLRYVNELRRPTGEGRTLGEWRPYLRDELLGFPASDLMPEAQVSHMVQEVRFSREDGTFVIRQGLLQGTPVTDPTSVRPAGPFYLLDFDYFEERDVPLDPQALTRQLKQYNETMVRFFVWCCSDRLLDEFGRADARRR